jgi:hypothetical protein
MQNKETVLVYNFTASTIYSIPTKDVEFLEPSQLILEKKPKSNCNKCFGRLYIGWEVNRNHYIPCTCVSKCFKKNVQN